MLKEIHEQPARGRRAAPPAEQLAATSSAFWKALPPRATGPSIWSAAAPAITPACSAPTISTRWPDGRPCRCWGRSSSSSAARASARHDTAVFVSQSGETKDVLNAIKVMRRAGRARAGRAQRAGLDAGPRRATSTCRWPAAMRSACRPPRPLSTRPCSSSTWPTGWPGRDTAELDVARLLARTFEGPRSRPGRVAGLPRPLGRL